MRTIIIDGGNSRRLPVSVKSVNSFTCPIIKIKTIGKKAKIPYKDIFVANVIFFHVMLIKKILL